MKIQTSRFGELEVENKDVIQFAEGPLGFEQLKKFFIVDPGDQTFILWLQSTENATVAFPILEPRIFKGDYSVRLLPNELQSLKLEDLNNASVFCILTLPKNIAEMSANLKAPLVINNKLKIGRQIVLQDSKLEVKHLMYQDLKRSINLFNSDSKVNFANNKTVIQTTQSSPSPLEQKTTSNTPKLEL
jgi:flagellar assembly factor FliW